MLSSPEASGIGGRKDERRKVSRRNRFLGGLLWKSIMVRMQLKQIIGRGLVAGQGD